MAPNVNELERSLQERELESERQAQEDTDYVDVGIIMQYESGELSEDDTICMFQKLVNSGVAWKLQGHYGRAASNLIESGLVTHPDARPKPRQFEIVRQTTIENDDGVVGYRQVKETLTIEARDWDDAIVQAAGMGGEAEVTAEIEQFDTAPRKTEML